MCGVISWTRLTLQQVSVAEDVQVARLCARDNVTPEQARQAVAAQMPTAEKARRADIVLDNSGTVDQLRAQMEHAHLI